MLIKRFVNKIFNSNTYLLYKLEEEKTWVIDPGSSTNQLINWHDINHKKIGGILLTHTHFDHIFGLNNLQKEYPNINVFASVFAKEGMMSEKLNGSLYNEIPFTIKNSGYITLKENDQILLWEEFILNVIETPGHDRDCLTFHIGKNLFTGDALIPGIKVHTRSKYSNKAQAINSIERIYKRFDDDTIIWPGHESECYLKHLIVIK